MINHPTNLSIQPHDGTIQHTHIIFTQWNKTGRRERAMRKETIRPTNRSIQSHKGTRQTGAKGRWTTAVTQPGQERARGVTRPSITHNETVHSRNETVHHTQRDHPSHTMKPSNTSTKSIQTGKMKVDLTPDLSSHTHQYIQPHTPIYPATQTIYPFTQSICPGMHPPRGDR